MLPFSLVMKNTPGIAREAINHNRCVCLKNRAIYLQQQYMDKNPRGVNPVQLNDVIFSLHAVAITIFTIFQCIIFEVRAAMSLQ